MKNNRLFGIIYMLLSSETMTAKKLADYFEVSTRTIYRDIETLCELNIPIYMNKGKNGGISLVDNYKLDKALLTDEEQKQILFSLEGINKLQVDSHKTYDKLKSLFTKNDENWFEVDFSIWSESPNHRQNFDNIKKAIIEKNVIEFSYFSSYGTHTKRRVEPLKLCFKYNSWYLLGFDQDKDDYRFFKIMRIKDLNILNESFERIAPNNDKKDDRPPKFIKLVLEVDSHLAYRVYDEFGESDIKISDNGNFIITTKLPFNDWIYGYILSFGENIKVLEPQMIRDVIIDKLQKSIDKYL